MAESQIVCLQLNILLLGCSEWLILKLSCLLLSWPLYSHSILFAFAIMQLYKNSTCMFSSINTLHLSNPISICNKGNQIFLVFIFTVQVSLENEKNFAEWTKLWPIEKNICIWWDCAKKWFILTNNYTKNIKWTYSEHVFITFSHKITLDDLTSF